MKPSVAFDICHEIYTSAREMVDTRLPTMHLDVSSKYIWRPDRRPRLIEYVSDFALAGQRALTGKTSCARCASARRLSDDASVSRRPTRALRQTGQLPPMPEAVLPAEIHASAEASISVRVPKREPCLCGQGEERRASLLILFRMYYLGGAEYQAARRHLGIGELTWVSWTDQIRARVGRELLRAGMFPPSRYFRQPTRQATSQPSRQSAGPSTGK